jgi:4'-phosphopantetheinyl transferase
MIKIYKANSGKFRVQNRLDSLLEKLPKELNIKALQYRFIQDSYNFVVGRYLLKMGLSHFGYENHLEKITYKKSGKPEHENIFFNISHSENMVVCALSSQGKIGIDIENKKNVILENFESWFTENEWLQIINSEFPQNKFYWYWTRKESILKAMGVNLSYLMKIQLDSTRDFFLANEQKWYLKDLDFGTEYSGSLCTTEVIDNINIEEVI